eukprot:1015843-Prorocentrum_minimum.AAC.3
MLCQAEGVSGGTKSRFGQFRTWRKHRKGERVKRSPRQQSVPTAVWMDRGLGTLTCDATSNLPEKSQTLSFAFFDFYEFCAKFTYQFPNAKRFPNEFLLGNANDPPKHVDGLGYPTL